MYLKKQKHSKLAFLVNQGLYLHNKFKNILLIMNYKFEIHKLIILTQ